MQKIPSPIFSFAHKQLQAAYALLDAARHPVTGLYADAYLATKRNPELRCSIAATGVGLIGLAVADQAGFDPGALKKAKTTLQTVLGETLGCSPARDSKTGFFAHFIHMETGENWRSEFSTIDTALLVTGALFVGNHFKEQDPEIEGLAQRLLKQIDWSAILVQNGQGSINMVIEDGRGSKPLPPFTEYAIVAYLAKEVEPDNLELQRLWSEYWAPESLERLPQIDFRGIPVLTDRVALEQGAYLSSFVHQFPFYLIPSYAKSAVYQEYFRHACLADRLKWKELDVPSYVWGYGAGPDDGLHGGYHANRINDAPGNVASAYIVAGFLPVYPEGIYDLYALYKLHLPYDSTDNLELRTAYRYGLHRYSWWHLTGPEQAYPNKVTLVDWSSMLYGLTAFMYGMSFFAERLP